MAAAAIVAQTVAVTVAAAVSVDVADAIAADAPRVRPDATSRPPNMLPRKAANLAATSHAVMITAAATSAARTIAAVSRVVSNPAAPSSAALTIADRKLRASLALQLPPTPWKNPSFSQANRSPNIAASPRPRLLHRLSNRNIMRRNLKSKTQLPARPVT